MARCRSRVLSSMRTFDPSPADFIEYAASRWCRELPRQIVPVGPCRTRLGLILAGLALMIALSGAACPALAQNSQSTATLAGENAHAREMQRLFPDRDRMTVALQSWGAAEAFPVSLVTRSRYRRMWWRALA